MNVGIVTTWFSRGAGYVSRQYRDALSTRHNVFIYCRGGEHRPIGDPEWDQDYVTWGAQPVVDRPDAVNLKDFDSWLRRRQLDVVFFNEQRWWEPVILCARRSVVCGAYIVHYTADTIPLFDCYDFVICNARHHYDLFRDHAQALFVPWGTDINRFRPRTTDVVKPGTVTFFHSAGMNPYRKGADLVLESFSELRASAALPRVVFHLQGGNDVFESNGQRFDRSFRSKLETIEMRDCVEVIESSARDPGEPYRLGDVCVYPTRHEGLGLTVAEALASGLPLIVTGNPPVNEYADGVLVRSVKVSRYYSRTDGDYWPQALVDTTALTVSMQEFLDRPELLPALKRKARRFAEEKLNWARNASGLPEIFASVRKIDSPRKRAALDEAKRFESDRIRLGLRNWVGTRHPWAISLGRKLRSSLKGLTH